MYYIPVVVVSVFTIQVYNIGIMYILNGNLLRKKTRSKLISWSCMQIPFDRDSLLLFPKQAEKGVHLRVYR